MCEDLLNEWVQALCDQPGRSVRAVEGQALFCVDPGDGPVLAIEWEPQSHTLHLYGHPGHARFALRAWSPEEASDDEREEGEPPARRAPVRETRVIELQHSADEQRHLHVQGASGLMTLSVRRALHSLDRTAFVALVDDVFADLALWVSLSSPDAQPEAPTPGEPPGVWPWCVAMV